MNAYGMNSWIVGGNVPSVLILGFLMVIDGSLVYTFHFFLDNSPTVYQLKHAIMC